MKRLKSIRALNLRCQPIQLTVAVQLAVARITQLAVTIQLSRARETKQFIEHDQSQMQVRS